MGLSRGYELATDVQFRELSNYATPPRAGKITAIEGSGQVRVDTDDPDGGDVLAWPLNGLTYAVDDVVYVAFAVNHPESALVIGSKGSDPSGGPFIRKSGADVLTGDWDIGEDRSILAERLEARDAEGLRLEDDGGNLGLFVEDGGDVGVGTASPEYKLHVVGSIYFAPNPYNSGGLFLKDSSGTAKFVLAVSSSPTNSVVLQSIGAGFNLRTAAGATHTRIEDDGDWGFGTTSPQGKLHVHDGTSGKLLVTKSAVVGTSQVIIPNGTGDVARGVTGRFDFWDGSTYLANTFTLEHVVTTFLDVSVGGSTWRITLNANGELSVARTSGTGSADFGFDIKWM